MELSAFFDKYGELLAQGTVDTTVMVLASTLGAYVIGIVLGTLLTVLGPDGLRPNRVAYSALGWLVNMARSLNLDIIAEGVETREQLEILHTLGADMGQGYLWSRPMPAADIVGWVGESMSAADLARFRALLRRG